MAQAIKNRYDFVILFDVEMEIRTAIRMQATCRALTRKRDMALLQMSA